MARNFIDTNILVYADANDIPLKQEKSIEIIRQNLFEKSGVISTQVLKEYANVAIKKLGLKAELIVQRIDFYSNFEIVSISKELILRAVTTSGSRRIGFYDALIIEAAKSSSCEFLLSEDMQSGAFFDDIQILNPY